MGRALWLSVIRKNILIGITLPLASLFALLRALFLEVGRKSCPPLSQETPPFFMSQILHFAPSQKNTPLPNTDMYRNFKCKLPPDITQATKIPVAGDCLARWWNVVCVICFIPSVCILMRVEKELSVVCYFP